MADSVKPDKKFFKKVLWIQLTISVLLLLIMAIVHTLVVVFDGKLEVVQVLWLIVISGIVLMWVFSTLIARLWIRNLEYVIVEESIKIHKGILTKTQQNIPFRMVTDFALERTLFDRILGLGSIKIQTAGQSHSPTGYEGKLSGLIAYEEWHNILREKIVNIQTANQEVTSRESILPADQPILQNILMELKEIRKNTEKK